VSAIYLVIIGLQSTTGVTSCTVVAEHRLCVSASLTSSKEKESSAIADRTRDASCHTTLRKVNQNHMK